MEEIIGRKLSLEEMQDLTDKLHQLMKIGDDRKKASADGLEANQRWNAARKEYADLYRKVVQQYGEKHAPMWIESLYGKYGV